jgi:hypothetical protein
VEAFLVDRSERLDDRGEQDHEAPEDEEVHHAGDAPLQELALSEHDDELVLDLPSPVPRDAVVGPAQSQEPHEVARAESEGGQRRQDQQRHDDLLEHRLSLLGGTTPLDRAAAFNALRSIGRAGSGIRVGGAPAWSSEGRLERAGMDPAGDC